MSQSYIPPAGAKPASFVGKQFFVPIEADATVFYVNNKLLGNFKISPRPATSVTSSGGTIGDNWTWQQAETVWSAADLRKHLWRVRASRLAGPVEPVHQGRRRDRDE